MMSFRLQVILFIFIITGIVYILRLVKKKYMDLRYALTWIFVSAGILVLTAFPKILDSISEILGIASPVNMLFFFGFCFSIVIIFSLSVALSHLSEKVKRMAQEIAIMKKDMYMEIKESKDTDTTDLKKQKTENKNMRLSDEGKIS
jgi:hypothetical protein